MEAKVVAIAFFLLLLTLATTADPATGNDRGEPSASPKNDFGVSAYAVNWKPPAKKEDGDFSASAYAVNWKPPAKKEDTDFGVSAYAVNWKPPAKKEDGDFGASAYAVNWKPPTKKEDGDFGVSAYPVKWKPPTKKEDVDFGVSAYAVNWKPPAKKEDGDFGVSAYPVKWKPPTKKEDGDFGVSAYAVNWKPPAKKEDGDFGVSAYAVNWKPPAKKEDGDFGVTAYAVNWKPPAKKEEHNFGASAYAVNWSPSASKEKGFAESSYAVDWDDEDSAPSPKGFAESSYAVDWDDEDSAPSPKGFAESSYAVDWDDEDSAPSHSPVPKAAGKHHHIKVQTGMLFLKKNMHVGTVLPEGTTFAQAGAPRSDGSVSTPLEPKSLATILSHFKIPHNSMKASQVADTLRSCDKPLPAGDKQEEPHMCFSSRGAMARFAAEALGVSRPVRAAITRIHGQETPSSSSYVVAKISQLSNDMVPCHPMDFPYEVFYCHRPKEVQAFKVQLKDQNNGVPLVTTTAMCHMNTSDWDKQYFELLGGVRGEPICHYMPQNYIMFY